MKKYSCRLSVFVLVMTAFAFVSCKKEKLRKKYEGDYLFTVHGIYSDTGHPSIDTTYTFSGTIEGERKKQDANVYLNVWYKSSSNYAPVVISDDGKFSNTTPVIYGSFSDDDHLSFTFDDLTQDHCYNEEVTGVRR